MSQPEEDFIQLAIEQARIAFNQGEVPVGAVIVKENQVIASAYNQTEGLKQATAHCEMLAIQQASRKLDNWRLTDCDIYVTLEPCMMCLGAILNSRIKKLVFSAREPRFGAVYSNLFVKTTTSIYQDPEIIEGILAEESGELIKDFFKKRREKK